MRTSLRLLLGLLLVGLTAFSWAAFGQADAKPSTLSLSQGNCSPAYPDFCLPPPPPDIDCEDIPWGDFTVRAPDPHGLDEDDKDGRGCETGKPRFQAAAQAATTATTTSTSSTIAPARPMPKTGAQTDRQALAGLILVGCGAIALLVGAARSKFGMGR